MRTVYRARLLQIPISGQWAIQNNEVNGWGQLGVVDNTNSLDYGDYTDRATINHSQMGGIEFPFDWRLRRFTGEHRNNNADAGAWGWLMYAHIKTHDTNTRTSTLIYDNGVPNNYGDNLPQFTDINGDDLTDNVIPAGTTLALALGCPAQGTNRNCQMYSGMMLIERLG